MERYNVPIWIKNFCLQDRNTPGRDWQNEPFVYQHEDEIWVFATDGYKLAGYRTDDQGPWSTESMYLKHIELPSIRDWIKGYLTKELTTRVNVDHLKSRITELLTNNGCEQCDHTLLITCTVCHGDTETECLRCRGAGSQPCVTCNKPDACDPCEGLGIVECMTCVDGKVNCPCLARQNAEAVLLPRSSEAATNPAPLNISKLQSALTYMVGDFSYCSGNISLFRKENLMIAIAGMTSVLDEDTITIEMNDIVADETTTTI